MTTREIVYTRGYPCSACGFGIREGWYRFVTQPGVAKKKARIQRRPYASLPAVVTCGARDWSNLRENNRSEES